MSGRDRFVAVIAACCLASVSAHQSGAPASSALSVTDAARPVRNAIDSEMRVKDAVDLLVSLGVPKDHLCTAASPSQEFLNRSTSPTSRPAPSNGLPLCNVPTNLISGARGQQKNQEEASPTRRWIRSRRARYLSSQDAGKEKVHDRWFYVTHAICALACVTTAALAAGLTMGLLSLDPLLLLIKVRAGATEKEQQQAAALLPIVKQHHLLLVTLLLLNSMANEALPLFLEVLVSPVMAVILSVTLVLFFGEIIPSAIFTGPKKVEIASRMVPIVKLVMILLWPLAFPIAKLLDRVLHDEDQESGDAFGRGELSALVRIQYEERTAHKKRHKAEREYWRNAVPQQAQDTSGMVDNVGALDFASTQVIKASKKTVDRVNSLSDDVRQSNQTGNGQAREENDPVLTSQEATRSDSIHLDEVSMVEGALSMKTKMALDVYTPVHRTVSIPYDMVLNEHNVVMIYSRGYSRIPVFMPNPKKPKSAAAVCGVLLTKQLIVVNPNDSRLLSTLPLAIPQCVSPKMNLVDLLNLFQTGRAGHLAFVCARPRKGQEALDQGKPLPEAAGFMG